VEVFEELFLTQFPESLGHDPDTLLGMDVELAEDVITLLQEKLINKGLNLIGLANCKPVQTPLLVSVQLKTATEDKKAEFPKLNINYRTFTGILNYLSC
jgi:hypothetical protein